MLEKVKRLAEAGFAVHLLHPKSKRPIGNDWADKPVATWNELKARYRDGCNVGVRLGKWSLVGDLFLHVIDMDVRKAELGAQAYDRLQATFPEVDFAKMPTVISGAGGASRHFYLLTDKPFTSKKLAHSEGWTLVFDEKVGKDVKKWDWELEFFGSGKQVVLPPSIHPDTGNPYRWLKRFDFELLELCGTGPIIPSSTIEAVLDIRPPASGAEEDQSPLGLTVEETATMLAKLPNEDVDYDDWLNVMASVQHEAFGRSKDERKLFYEAFRAWSAQSAKHDDETARYKFFSFKNRGDRANRTMRSVANEVREIDLQSLAFDDLDEDEDGSHQVEGVTTIDDEIEDLGTIDEENGVPERERKLRKEKVETGLGKKVPPKVARLNERFAIARVSSKTVIMDFHKDGSVTYGSVHDLHNYFENDRVATEKATEAVTRAWLRHPDRRDYPNGIVFAPGRDVPGAFNHWQGFAVEPDATKSCALLLKHMRDVLCQGDEAAYRYLLGWCAHMIQQPEDKPGVAVVIRGRKGVGKDTLGVYLGSLFPHHHITISNQDQLLGKFNAHQEKCLLLHVEEGYWAGSKGAEGQLKHMITSETVMIEPKGMNAFKVNSVLRLFMTSNEDWVVPATSDERRFFVLDAGEEYRNDPSYFTPLRAELKGDGPAALLAFLQSYDLKNFNVRMPPKTKALGEQKVFGLRNFDRWWFGVLQTGAIETAIGDWSECPLVASPAEMRESYSRWMRNRRFDGEELRDFEIGRRLKHLCKTGERVKRRIEGKHAWFYRFRTLAECRKEFEAYLGSHVTWEEIQQVTEDDEIDI